MTKIGDSFEQMCNVNGTLLYASGQEWKPFLVMRASGLPKSNGHWRWQYLGVHGRGDVSLVLGHCLRGCVNGLGRTVRSVPTGLDGVSDDSVTHPKGQLPPRSLGCF